MAPQLLLPLWLAKMHWPHSTLLDMQRGNVVHPPPKTEPPVHTLSFDVQGEWQDGTEFRPSLLALHWVGLIRSPAQKQEDVSSREQESNDSLPRRTPTGSYRAPVENKQICRRERYCENTKVPVSGMPQTPLLVSSKYLPSWFCIIEL
ncbi:hypothetical protein ACRALDRAFT_1068229 [Sodiomyces alcalophilus JCM 7366]|uniref:uncharacterized protein n=1 Tax=Sodiomyces alcalophilus JCM 7366 TaxID=591952 RepID=UPI0039B3DD5C